MSQADERARCDRTDSVVEYLFNVMQRSDAIAMQVHVDGCEHCTQELERLRPVVDSLVVWPTDVLRPSASLQERLAHRIAAETNSAPVLPVGRAWKEPEWEEVVPGILCKILTTDSERDRVTMLVRLRPGVSYPPHTHAGVEELHLLDGELWIEDRLLRPGDYNYGKPGASDQRVYSETGCTCVLITSPSDILRP
jgi:quercetin dioxygenase-like cupin family protein